MSIQHLVVDANAFIKGFSLQELSQKVYSIPEVIKEIRDSATRQRLEFTPYKLSLKDPSPDNVKRATEFSKKTGDYPSLSLVDIKLIALAIELHEAEGIQVILKADSEDTESTKKEVEDVIEIENEPVVEVEEKNQDGSDNDEGTDDEFEDVDDENEVESQSEGEDESEETQVEEIDDKSEWGGWITPSNYKTRAKPVAVTSPVGVLTTDFAMQNVILHTNMTLISPQGNRITTLRSYVLRCYGCYEKTTQFDRKFCPRCGNRTLTRVSVSVQDGNMKLHLSKKFVLSARGKKFSLPAPKGGKYGVNPVLTEDQHVTDIRRSKKAVAREIGPFAMNDVSTRSFMVQGLSSHYWDSKNPNQVKRGTGGRKRRV